MNAHTRPHATALMQAPQVIARRQMMRDTGQHRLARIGAGEWLLDNGTDSDKAEARRVLFWLKPQEASHG